jgi:arylsulfatase A-like enzyme
MGERRLTRRKFMGATAAGAAAALATTHLGCWPWSSRSRTKNVILIISDSLRRDAVGFYDDQPPGVIPSEPNPPGKFEPAHMPNLGNFAKSAVRFNNGYVSSFPTVPARHDILTGTYTFLYKLWGPLNPKKLTLQKLLTDHHIYTAGVSDVPHPFSDDGERPAKEVPFKYQRGFDKFKHIRGQENDPYITGDVPIKFPCDENKLRLPDTMVTQYLKNASIRKKENGEKDWYSPQTFDWATQWLKENSYSKQPFFLYVDTFDPHEPWDPPKHYVEQYDLGYTGQDVIAPRYEFWKKFLTPAELKHCQALYKGEASMVDAWFGKLMDTIIELNLLENTLVLFITDHGVSLGERGIIGKGVIRGSGEKSVSQSIPLLPEICRIPMLAHFPNCKAGTSIDGLAQPANIPATILDYFGIPIPETDFKAPSLWPLLAGRERSVQDYVISSPTLSAYDVGRVPRPTDRPTITDGRWLLVYSCAGWGDELQKKPHDSSWKEKRRACFTGELLTPQLYDLENDPGCRVNLYPNEKDRARKLHSYLCDFIKMKPWAMRDDHWGYFEHLENN